MPSFATVEDFATFYPDDLSAEDTATTTQNLAIASEMIRQHLNLTVDLVEDDEIEMVGENTANILLPEFPVVDLTIVEIDGIVLDPTGYRFYTHGLLTRSWGWKWWAHNTISITYSHGWSPIPDDIKGVCMELAARMFGNSSGAQSQGIGTYSESWGPAIGAGSGWDDLLSKLDGRRRLVPV